MDKVPVVRQVDPWRALAAYAIMFGVAGGLTLGIRAPGQTIRVSDIQDLLLLAVIIAILYSSLVTSITRRVLRAEVDAFKALRKGDYASALASQLSLVALLERRPWLDRWRTILFLNMSYPSWKELAQANAADSYARLGRVQESIEMCERCLAEFPKSILALSTINIVNLFTGGPLRPECDIDLLYAYDRGHRSLARYVPYGVSLALGMVFVFPLMIELMRIDTDSLVAYAVPLGVFVALVFGFPPGYRWVSRHAFLPDMVRGIELVRKADYAGAIDAFQRQVNSLMLTPFLDRWRLALLFEPSAYSYREWALLYQVTPWSQLGRADRVAALYEECLKLNPGNVYAKSGLDLVRNLQAVSGQKTVIGEQ